MKSKPCGPLVGATMGLLLAALGFAWAQETAPPEEVGPQPALVVEKTLADAGRVKRGETALFTFVLRNAGEADLQILKVKPGCGCTAVKYDPVIPPGEERPLQFEMKTQGFRGEVTKVAQVLTNDPDPQRGQVSLRMKVHVVAPVEILPRNHVTLLFKKAEPVRQEFQLFANEGPPLEIQAVKCSLPEAQVEVLPPEQIEGRQVCRLLFQRPVQGRPTAFSGYIVVETNNPQEPRLTLSLAGQPTDAVFLRPLEMNFGQVLPHNPQPVLRMVTLMRSEGTFRVLEATTEDPHLQINVQQVNPGHLYQVSAIYREGWAPGPRKGTLRVKTDDPEAPEWEIPFSAFVREEMAAPPREAGPAHSEEPAEEAKEEP